MKLYPHQLKALEKIHNGCILCGGVGSGKTLTSLSYYYLQNGGVPEALRGIGKPVFTRKPQDLIVITTARKRDTLEWEGDMLPFLLSYGSYWKNDVVVDSWNNIGKYIDRKGCFFIFDEQRVVGYGAWTKSFLKITKQNDWILLSATPGDVWTDYIPVFIANGFYKNKTEFNREHVVYRPFTKYPQIDHFINDRRLVRLRDSILVDMSFERKTVRHSIDVVCQYDILAYKKIISERVNPYTGEPIQNAGELCMCMRRIVNTDTSRIEKVLEIAEQKKKLIIFYNFNDELEMLRNAKWESSTEVAEWNGHHHQPLPESSRWVYLVQYTAGAEGWNCIRTDTIIFFSQTYSYRTLEQSMGRIDRLNTPYRDLFYYHLRSYASIDAAIRRALNNKKRFNEGMFANKIQ